MRKQTTVIPPNIARLMSAEQLREFGILPPEEQAARCNLILEVDIHGQFKSWLNRHGFTDYYYSDPRKIPTIKAGLPDFGVYRDSRIIWIEFKVPPKGLNIYQEEVFGRMGRQGNIILICYTADEAQKAITKFFNL